jgi:hypothetical protein
MKNFNDTIGNRTSDLPACSAVPQPTAPPRALKNTMLYDYWYFVMAKYFSPFLEHLQANFHN